MTQPILAAPAPPPVKPPATPPVTPPAVPVTPPGGGVDPATLLDEPVKPAWHRRPMVWAAALLLVVAGGGLWWWQARMAAQAAPSYNTQKVGRGDLTLTVSANGTLQPTRSISIGSELSGTVLKVNVDVNDVVTKGQVLVVLDTAKLNDQILRSKATLSAANSRVDQNAATVKEAAAKLARLEAVAILSGGKVPSQAELDSARATLARAKAEVSGAQASVRDALAALSTICPRRRSPHPQTALC